MTPLRIVYDGECPFCGAYVRLMRLRKNFAVELIDARRQPERANSYGLDLNAGMIADLDGRIHHGADAVWLLSTLSSRAGFCNRMTALLFSWKRFVRLSYPVLRFFRTATLKILGRKLLNFPSRPGR